MEEVLQNYQEKLQILIDNDEIEIPLSDPAQGLLLGEIELEDEEWDEGEDENENEDEEGENGDKKGNEKKNEDVA
jgi:hypothetical protein